jgi:hypothetical protein
VPESPLDGDDIVTTKTPVAPHVIPLSPPRQPLGCAAAPVQGTHNVIDGCGDGGQVSVVDRALLDLAGELPQQIHPRQLSRPRRRDGGRSLDDLEGVRKRQREPAPWPGAGWWPNTTSGSVLVIGA